jgi:hypothetical protein
MPEVIKRDEQNLLLIVDEGTSSVPLSIATITAVVANQRE